jgi:hypothetical protein
MCGRLSQYRGIHDFVAALSMPGALVNKTGDLLFERYNAAPSTRLALFHLEGVFLHTDTLGMADTLGKRSRRADQYPDCESTHGPFSVRSGHTARSSPSTTGLSGWMKADRKSSPTLFADEIERRYCALRLVSSQTRT